VSGDAAPVEVGVSHWLPFRKAAEVVLLFVVLGTLLNAVCFALLVSLSSSPGAVVGSLIGFLKLDEWAWAGFVISRRTQQLTLGVLGAAAVAAAEAAIFWDTTTILYQHPSPDPWELPMLLVFGMAASSLLGFGVGAALGAVGGAFGSRSASR
jgi:hypothetical protein